MPQFSIPETQFQTTRFKATEEGKKHGIFFTWAAQQHNGK